MRRSHTSRIPLICLAAVVCWLSLFCSRSDVITGAGGSVVTDMDPTLTDLGRGFVHVRLTAAAVDSASAFSLPMRADPVFTTQASGSLVIGVSEDGDTVAAHVQYRVSGGAQTAYTKDDELLGVRVHFPGDTLFEAGPIALFPSDTLLGLAPVNRGDKRPCVDVGGDGGGCVGAVDNRIGDFVLGAADDSLRSVPLLDTLLVRRIFNARVSGDSAAYAAFAFSVVDYGGALRRAGVPYIVVSVKKQYKDDVVSDTITGFARHTAFEGDSAAAARALLPYSSQFTKRTAVFRVDVTKIVDTLALLGLSGNKSELMNAVMQVKFLPEAEGGDSASASPSGTRNAANYKVLFLDTLVTDEIVLGLDSAALASRTLLYNKFAALPSTAPTIPFNTHSFKDALRSAMARHQSGMSVPDAKPYVYVYLRPVAENSAILWERPPKIETVFTPSRSSR